MNNETITIDEGRDDLPIFIHSELDDLPLSLEAFRIYAHLARRAGKSNQAWPSYSSMAEACFRISYPNASKETLRRKAMAAMKELVDAGLVEKANRFTAEGDMGTNAYRLTPRSKWGGVVSTHHGGVNAPKGSPLEGSNSVPTERDEASASPDPELTEEELKERGKLLKQAYIEARGTKNFNHGAVGKGVQQLAKANCTPDELRQCYEWLKADSFWEFKPILPQVLFTHLDEFRRYRDKAQAMNGADPSSKKLQATRSSFDSFPDYNAWAEHYDPQKKLLYEGVMIGGSLIKRPRPPKGTEPWMQTSTRNGHGVATSVRMASGVQ